MALLSIMLTAAHRTGEPRELLPQHDPVGSGRPMLGSTGRTPLNTAWAHVWSNRYVRPQSTEVHRGPKLHGDAFWGWEHVEI